MSDIWANRCTDCSNGSGWVNVYEFDANGWPTGDTQQVRCTGEAHTH